MFRAWNYFNSNSRAAGLLYGEEAAALGFFDFNLIKLCPYSTAHSVLTWQAYISPAPTWTSLLYLQGVLSDR